MSGYRLTWAAFDTFAGSKAKPGRQDFPSKEEAEAAKRQKQQELGPDAVVSVTPITLKPKVEKRERIGPGHPEYQGERRLTR